MKWMGDHQLHRAPECRESSCSYMTHHDTTWRISKNKMKGFISKFQMWPILQVHSQIPFQCTYTQIHISLYNIIYNEYQSIMILWPRLQKRVWMGMAPYAMIQNYGLQDTAGVTQMIPNEFHLFRRVWIRGLDHLRVRGIGSAICTIYTIDIDRHRHTTCLVKTNKLTTPSLWMCLRGTPLWFHWGLNCDSRPWKVLMTKQKPSKTWLYYSGAHVQNQLIQYTANAPFWHGANRATELPPAVSSKHQQTDDFQVPFRSCDVQRICPSSARALFASAPFSSSQRTTSKWPFWAAMDNGVAPSVLALSMSSPASTSILTTSVWPFWAARSRGVAPSIALPLSASAHSATVCEQLWHGHFELQCAKELVQCSVWLCQCQLQHQSAY